jgi:hypothetical protein
VTPAKEGGEWARLARLALAARRVRGHRWSKDHELAADWLRDLRVVWDVELRASERLWLGFALRSLLADAETEWPEWFVAGEPWFRDPLRLALIAELRDARGEAELLAELPRQAPARRAALRRLRFGQTKLPAALLAELEAGVLSGKIPDAELGASLELLQLRGRPIRSWDALTGGGLPVAAFGESVERGEAFAATLLREGLPGWRLGLRSLAKAKSLTPGHLGLLSVMSSGALADQLVVELNRLEVSPFGQALLDLGLSELSHLRQRNQVLRDFLLGAHQRLAELQASANPVVAGEFAKLRARLGAARVDRVLGRAQARVRMALPVPPDRKRVGVWIAEMLSDVQTREIGFGAALLALRERATLRVELTLRLRNADRQLRQVLPELLRAGLARLGDPALCPLDPGDPLLR